MTEPEPGRVVVVGASAAGLAVVETLRRDGYGGRIALIGAEEHLPYDRPPLSKQILSGVWADDRAYLRDEAALKALDLDLRLGIAATGADAAARTVTLAGGETVPYDALVVATGVRARRLPGTDGVEGVHVLRTLADARGLRAELVPGRRLVVVGAGFLGAEAAAAARQSGVEVTLISDLAAPLADVLGPEVGAMLVDLHREHGVTVLTSAPVAEIVVVDGRAAGVRLADGRLIEADGVLVAIGGVPNVEWLTGSGIETGNGVLCDEYCRAVPGVWAAGDVAAWIHPAAGRRMRLEHRTHAAEQGAVVARNILARDGLTSFAPIPFIWSDQYDRKIQIYGLPRGADRFTITEGSLQDGSFIALYGTGDTVSAAVGVNRARQLRAARSLIGTPWAEAGQAG